MSLEKFTAPSTKAMDAILPAFEFTDVVTSSDLGAVYFANQRSLDRKVAIKIYSPALGADADFLKSFENASKGMAGLRHPNLIGLLDSGIAGEMPYRVMEFVPGKSLARSTRGKVIQFEQSMALFDAICEGLAHAHEGGLVHGTLDTLSILLNQQAVPKIGNFGLDRPVHTDPAAHPRMHTIAPEVIAKSGQPTERSDIFSLGAIFYELITGRPFEQDGESASKITRCKLEVDAVLKQATAENPADRLPDMRAFQTALKEAASGKSQKKQAGARVASGASPAAASPPANMVAPLPPKSAATSLAVKIGIIIALLVAINFTWKAMKKAQADRARENIEIQAKAERDRAIAQAQADEKRARELAQLAALKNQQTEVPKYEPKVETPEESLARLKSSLASGNRSEMPIGSVVRGDSVYFLVSEPMGWAEAAWFAEQHGGFLAMPDSDIAWLTADGGNGNGFWLGAARSGAEAWTLVNGAPWTPTPAPAGNGPYLAVGRSGEFTAVDDRRPLPSVIQWRSDRSNPGTLAAALAATSRSLGGANPVYPPGTVASGSRHYLIVPRPVTWTAARALAESGGGHLMVPSDTGEIAKLDEMTKRIRADDGIWIGGSLEGAVWSWVTGEPWTEAKWVGNAGAGDKGAAVVVHPGRGWDAMARNDEASGFIIEWSDDFKKPKAGGGTAPAAGASAELAARVKELVLAAEKKRTDALAANVKKFRWDLDAFLRGLPGSGQAAWAPHVNALKDCVEDDHIMPREVEQQGISLSAEMLKVSNYHIEKQREYAAQFASDMAKIRDAYVAKLAGIRDDAKAAGQAKIAEDSTEAIEDAENLDRWAESFGLTIEKPEND